MHITHVSCLSNGSIRNWGGHSCSIKLNRRNRNSRRCISCVYQNGNQPLGNTTSASNRAALQEKIGAPIDVSREAVTTQIIPLAGVRKSYRVSFFDAMKFNGPAPERINGRLAMLGFLLGSIGEFKTAVPIMEQAQAAPIPVLLVMFLFSWASLIPITKGARSEAFGIFSPRAEITNGRAAMLGIAILLFLEYNPGASFF